MLALAILAAALLTALWSDRIPLFADLASADSTGPERVKSRSREMDAKSPTAKKRTADPVLVKQWMDELLERHPEAKAEIWDLPTEENGHLAWVEFSEEVMDGIELPECVSEYVSNPNAENRKCAEEWLSQNNHIVSGLKKIAAFGIQSMGDVRLDGFSAPGVRNFDKALYIMLARGLIAAEAGNEAFALTTFSSALNLVPKVDGIEATSLIGRIIAIGVSAVVYESFINRIYPSIEGDWYRLRVWRATLSPDDMRDGLTRALIGENLRETTLLISIALSGEFETVTEFKITDAEAKILIDCGFESKARVIAALKSGASLESIPAIYGQSIDTHGLSGECRDFFTEQMETSQSALVAILKKETRLFMYDAALAAAMGEEIPIDPVSGKPFQWDGATMTLSAPEGTPSQKPIILPAGN